MAHTRQRLDEQHAKMKRLVLERAGNVDPVEAQLDHAISSIFDITEEHKATREAAALQRTAKHSGVAHKASASQAHDVNNFGQAREETHEESAMDGPAAVWVVFTNATWSSQNAWRSSPEVANLVSERAMHILCRGQDEADTQRIMRRWEREFRLVAGARRSPCASPIHQCHAAGYVCLRSRRPRACSVMLQPRSDAPFSPSAGASTKYTA